VPVKSTRVDIGIHSSMKAMRSDRAYSSLEVSLCGFPTFVLEKLKKQLEKAGVIGNHFGLAQSLILLFFACEVRSLNAEN
jgi:hypothetical protein